MAKKAIELRKNPKARAMLETKMHYDVLLFGNKVSEIYFNMRGYSADHGIPQTNGHGIDIGEKGISAFTREIAVQNELFEQANQTGETFEVAQQRREVLERFFKEADLNLDNAEASEWNRTNDIQRLQDDDYRRDLKLGDIKHKLHITFYAGTAIFQSVDIDGNNFDGDNFHLYPFNVIGVTRKTFEDRRRQTYLAFLSNFGTYTGHQIERADGSCFHIDGVMKESFFVQAPTSNATPPKVTLVVNFIPSTAIIASATLDDQLIDYQGLFPFNG